MSHSIRHPAGAMALALALSSLVAAPAVAGVASAGYAAGDGALAEVVITATRTPTPSDEIAVPVIVITREEIERSQATDLAELLQGRPGIEIGRTGGPGQSASVFLRGSNSNHTTVLVDGVRVNPGTIGGAPLQNIQPESIERIEIVEGARASLYGTDAIGGVINVITRAGSAAGATAYAGASRYGTRELAGSAGADLGGGLAAGLGYAWQRSDGFPPRFDAPDPGDYDNTTLNARLQYHASDALALRAQAWRATGVSAYSDFGFPARQAYTDAAYAIGGDFAGTGGGSGRATLSRAVVDYSQRTSPDYDRTRRDTLDAQYAWNLPAAQRLAVGAVAADEDTHSLVGGGMPWETRYDVRTRTTLAWVQDQWRGDGQDLLLAAALAHHEAFGSRSTWNAEYTRRFGADWRGSLAAGTAFHAPDSTDRYGYGGNPQLRPEQSRQAQASLHWQPHDSLHWRLTAYENRVDGLIDLALVDPVNFIYQAQNIERARIRALELAVDATRGAWALSASATDQDARDLTADAPLLRRARRNAQLSLRYAAARVTCDAAVQVAGPRPDYGGVVMGGYSLLSLGASYEFAPGWNIGARIGNVLDRRYELASGYRTPGRDLRLALRYRLR